MKKLSVNPNLQTSQFDNENWEKALSTMPRGSQTMSKCPDQFVDGVHPKFIQRGEGVYIYDHDNNRYLDYAMGLGPIILGHCNKDVNNAVINQLKKGCCFSLPSILESKLAELIIEVIPCAEQVRFAKNGTDANLGAVRAARSFTNREHILCCGYHGWGDWYASSTERDYGIPTCLKKTVHHFEYNNLENLEEEIKKWNPACVIMEACALTNPDNGFLEGVRELCTKNNIILIFDEIVTGFRWSLGGAQEKYGVIPDMCTIGKAMANGFPISAVCGRKDIMDEFNHIFFSMTFGGELCSIAASISTIEILKTKDYNYIWDLGEKLHKGITDSIPEMNIFTKGEDYNPISGMLRGEPPRHHMSLYNIKTGDYLSKNVFYQEMIRKGILWGNVIYVTFAHTEDHINYTIKCAKDSLDFIYDNRKDLESVLDGKPSVDIFRKNT